MAKLYRQLGSNGERNIRSVLFTLGVQYEIEKEFPGLIDKHTKGNLRFDFYLPLYNICIEYDGLQHYTPNNKFHKTGDEFVQQKIRDNIKSKYCDEHGIVLIRISYREGIVIKLTRLLKPYIKDNNERNQTNEPNTEGREQEEGRDRNKGEEGKDEGC